MIHKKILTAKEALEISQSSEDKVVSYTLSSVMGKIKESAESSETSLYHCFATKNKIVIRRVINKIEEAGYKVTKYPCRGGTYEVEIDWSEI